MNLPTVRRATTLGRMAKRRNRTPWTADELALLGKMPDKQIAKLIGRPSITVAANRTRRGIPAFTLRVPTIWSDAQLQLLEHNDDLRVAQLTGKLLGEVRAKRAELAKR